LLAHLAPPVLILVAVALAPMVASFLAGILAAAHVDAPDPGGRRLTVNVLTLVAAVQAAMAAAVIPLWADTGLPSVSEIGRLRPGEADGPRRPRRPEAAPRPRPARRRLVLRSFFRPRRRRRGRGGGAVTSTPATRPSVVWWLLRRRPRLVLGMAAVVVVVTGLVASAVPVWLAAGLMLVATVAGVGW